MKRACFCMEKFMNIFLLILRATHTTINIPMSSSAVTVEDFNEGANKQFTEAALDTMSRRSGGYLYVFINPLTGRPTNLSLILIGTLIIWVIYASQYGRGNAPPQNPKKLSKLGEEYRPNQFDERNNIDVQERPAGDSAQVGFNPDLIPFQHLVHPHQQQSGDNVVMPAGLKMAGVPQDTKKVPAERQNIPRPKPKDFPVDILFQPEINALKCPVTTYVLIFVATLPSEFVLRNSIRRTWGNPANFDEVKIVGLTWKVVFAMGNGNGDEDEKIRNESERYADVLQGKFDDTSVEDTRKTMMFFKWVTDDLSKYTGCRPAFVLKTPAKVYIHIPYVLSWIAHTVKDLQNVYRGKILRGDMPIRTPEDPLFVSKEDFAGDTFPDLIRGPVYLFSTDVVERMVERIPKITPIAMEDAYLGLLAQNLGIKPVHDERVLLMQRPRNVCHYKKMMFVYDVTPAEQVHVFNVVERNHMADECKEDRGL